MKKGLALFGIVGLVAMLGLTGCNGGSGEPTSLDPNTEVTIDYWSIYPDSDEYAPKHQALLDAFMEEHPNIKINHHGFNFYDYFTKVSTAQAGGTDIDVYWNDIVNVKYRAESGVAANLKPYMDADSFDLSQFSASSIESATYNDGIYALPVESDVRVLFYNKDLFEEAGLDPESPPTSFEEMYEYNEKLIKVSEDGTTYDRIGFHPMLGDNAIQCFVWPMGGSFFDEDGNPTLNTEINKKAMQWWVDFNKQYDSRKINVFTATYNDAGGADTSFLQGVNAMVIAENGLAWQIEKNAPDLNYGIAPIPYYGEENHVTWSGAFTLEVSGRTTDVKKQAAWEFVKYMTSVEVQEKFMDELNFMPANLDAQAILAETANENQKVIFNEFQYARHMDYCKEAPQWWSGLSGDLFQASGDNMTVEECANKAQSDLEKLIEEYRNTH